MANRRQTASSTTTAFTTKEQRWNAVVARDRAADGQFVYAVRSTRIFCHPSCPSRPARQANVTFYADATEAAAAGYRPCKRCRPGLVSRSDQQTSAIEKACRIVRDAADPPSLEVLAKAVGMSAYHFHRTFKAALGVTPKAYIDAERSKRMRDHLAAGTRVTSAIYDAGYGSNSRFYEKAQERLGMTATVYQRGGGGLQIRFAVGQCSLGAILVAATSRGLCAIELDNDPQALVTSLQDRFPRAEFIGADRAFEKLVAKVVAAVERPGTARALPLDIQGTAFQERVWQALRDIPAGTTASYRDIAAAIGAPSATRAVANACGANPVAVAIPCHRVVRTDGSLGGYRWGIERKRALLEREAA
jgi:AraC family transcriptional regulator, regulatory protein of adaptative response / methylated-DNA-[protein]-cysteine methyltransferase